MLISPIETTCSSISMLRKLSDPHNISLACPRVFIEELLVRSRGTMCILGTLICACVVVVGKVVVGNTAQLEPLGGRD